MADGAYRIDLHSHAGRCFLAGLPSVHVHQILGGNALELLGHLL